MTGSGKSEFLQEYILSLMLNYSPDDIAFILIDFKGGDMARPFFEGTACVSYNFQSFRKYAASCESFIGSRNTEPAKTFLTQQRRSWGFDKLDINSWHKYMEEGKIKKKLTAFDYHY